jgi:O-antigen ligase
MFLLPWQTRWIYKSATLNGTDWEYGTLSIYITELLIALILGLTAYYVWHLRKTGQKITQYKTQSYIILGVSLLALYVPAALAIDSELAIYKVNQIILVLALMFAILIIKPNKFIATYAIITASVIQSFLAINQFIAQKVFASTILGMSFQNPLILGTPVIETGLTRLLRPFGSLPHPNILAGFLVISLILIMGCSLTAKHKRKLTIALILAFCVNLLALLLTASKAGLLALLLSLVIFFFLAQKSERFALNKFFLITLLVIVVFSLVRPDIVMTRLKATNRLEDRSYTERLEGYREATNLLHENFLSGTGPGNYTLAQYNRQPSYPGYTYQPLHNAGLLILTELGALGLVLILTYLSLLVYLFKQHFLKINHSYLTTSYVVASAALIILSLFDHYLYSLYFGLLLSGVILAFTIHTLIHREPA